MQQQTENAASPRSIELTSVYNQRVQSGNAMSAKDAQRNLVGTTRFGSSGNGMSDSTLQSKQSRYQIPFSNAPA